MKYGIVTTFAAKHYELYGRRMIETFDKHWPKEVEFHIYHEGDIPKLDNPRIFYHDLLGVNPDLAAFKERHKNDPVANGQPNNAGTPDGKRRSENIKERWKLAPAYLWDAVRFSHKVYAQTHFANTTDCDVMFWVDADTITYRDIGDSYKSWLPENVYCSYLGRNTYTECGFIGFNLKHPHNKEFMARYKELYDTDNIFRLFQWTDCQAFDKVRTEMENENKIKNYNININNTKGHPFINSVLGAYMDHLKGTRKTEGRSRLGDIFVDHGTDYWKRNGK